MKLLVANRGEIARRVLRTAKRLNWETLAIFSDPDREAAFASEADERIRIGGPELADSYLNTEKILQICRDFDVTAVHPGYGFLSENAHFASQVTDAGVIWVGPNPQAIASMGSKIEARYLAEEAGIPVIPGFADGEQQGDEALLRAAESIGYPILLKAAAGGGGKGIRIALSSSEFPQALADARTEASRSFSNDQIIVERFIQNPRHVEVQLLGDQHGNLIELGTRDCTTQRRYQKLVEEAPAPNLPMATENGLREAAITIGRVMSYDNAGTVEFVGDADTGEYFFLEVNTRLQVEHPVTELVTGLDLVEMQLKIAQGNPLPITQNDVVINGHAVEVRINAEDPGENYAPQTGKIDVLLIPSDEGVRWDGAFDTNGEITPFYDGLIGKLITWGVNRESALDKMQSVITKTFIGPLTTNLGLHHWVLSNPKFRSMEIATTFLDQNLTPPVPNPEDHVGEAASALRLKIRHDNRGPWHQLSNFHLVPNQTPLQALLRDSSGQIHEVYSYDKATFPTAHFEEEAGLIIVNHQGNIISFELVDRAHAWTTDSSAFAGSSGDVTAPFPAVVISAPVKPGDAVSNGDAVMVIEAMKMLHSLTASGGGEVDRVWVDEGDAIEAGQILVSFTKTDTNEEESA